MAEQRRTLHFTAPLSRHHLAGLKASPHQLVRASWLPSYGPAPTFLLSFVFVHHDRVSQFFYSPPADEPPEKTAGDRLLNILLYPCPQAFYIDSSFGLTYSLLLTDRSPLYSRFAVLSAISPLSYRPLPIFRPRTESAACHVLCRCVSQLSLFPVLHVLTFFSLVFGQVLLPFYRIP